MTSAEIKDIVQDKIQGVTTQQEVAPFGTGNAGRNVIPYFAGISVPNSQLKRKFAGKTCQAKKLAYRK